MAVLTGKSLRKYVQNQIKVRQETHGSGVSGNRTPNQLAYLNSKTAWVKMASGIRITNQFTKDNLDIKATGTSLAKQYVLFNGVSSLEGNKLNPRGNSDGNNIYDPLVGTYNVKSLYSNPGTGKFGLVPMPGITDVNIECVNRGSIKKATINVKCYSPEQFAIMDALYLRIGYTMLLEWGWSTYLDASGNFQQVGQTLVENPDGIFSDRWKKSSYSGFLPKIANLREKYQGNYDGMLGKVSNFSWDFNPDGSYNISITLLSLGDIIESLKCNITPTSNVIEFVNKSYKLFNDEQETETDSAQKQSSKVPPSPINNVISSYFFAQKIYLTTVESNLNYFKKSDGSNDCACTYKGGIIPVRTKFIDKAKDAPDFGVPYDRKNFVYANYNTLKSDDDLLNNEGLYVRFGHFLEFLQSQVVFKVKGTSNYLLSFDTDIKSNKMYTFPYQVSLDPRVCIVRNDKEPINSKKYYSGASGGGGLPQWKIVSGTTAHGQIMNIYLNCQMIAKVLESKQDNKGDVSLYDMLSSICSNLNIALGGVNNLEPVIDEETNTVTIIDGSYSEPSDKVLVELYGYNGNTSNFVKDININTKIDNNFSTMASVGSTNTGYVKGTENTMFAKWNKGLVDIFKEEFVPATKKEDSKSSKDEADLYVLEFWNKTFAPFGLTAPQDIPSTNAEVEDACALEKNIIDKNVKTVTEFFKYCSAQVVKSFPKYSSPSPGFVPISLGLTFDGISGIRIYDAIDFSTRFLPSTYPNSLKFLATKVNHKISDNEWSTEIETSVVANMYENQTPILTYKQLKSYVKKFINQTQKSLQEKDLPKEQLSTPPITPSIPTPPVTSGNLSNAVKDTKSYVKTDMQSAPFPIQVTGQYTVPPTAPGKGDAFHSFTFRNSDKFGGRLFTGAIPAEFQSSVYKSNSINDILQWLNSYGRKAEVSSIEFELNFSTYTVTWRANIGASTDGKAYLYGSSRGGYGGGKAYSSWKPTDHPAGAGTIGIAALQKGNWKWIPVAVSKVSPSNYRQYEQAQPGTIEIVDKSNKLILRQFFIQSTTGIW
jgi:hypothetical protein